MKPAILLSRGMGIAAIAALALAISPGIAQPGEVPASRPHAAPLPLGPSIPIQGRLTDAAGHPLPDGSYDVVFEVCYSGGVCPCADAYSLSVENGLFSTVISDCSPDVFDGQQLDLQITVEGELLTPRQPIYASPYAWSLKPGAIIHNYGTGHALSLVTSTSGGSNSALYAENSNPTSGIAIWGKAAGNDASVVIENLGSGALLKGFGGDGGDDEFRVGNDGTIWSKADTFWHVPGIEIVGKAGGTPPIFQYKSTGAVDVIPIGGTQVYVVLLPISLPTILYGGQVQIEGLSVYYKVSESPSYIDRTRLIRASGTGTEEVLADLITNQNSTGYTSYSPVVDAPLGYGSFVTLELTLFIWEDWSVITIGGVDLQLGHHPLY